MCSNDRWSCGSTRRQSERGSSDRRQQDPAQHPPRGVLSSDGGERVVVLQVASAVPDAVRVAPPGPRQGRAGCVRGLREHLRVPPSRRRVARRRLGGLDEDRRRLDETPRAHRAPQTPHTQAIAAPRGGRCDTGGSAGTELRRRSAEPEVGRGLQTDPHRRGPRAPRRGRGPLQPAPRGVRAQRSPPHRRPGRRRHLHGHSDPRRRRRRGDLSHRPRPAIRRRSVRGDLRAPGHHPVHGTPRQRLGQRPSRAFFATLQKELLHRRRYRTRVEARRDIAAWIDSWYNPRRRHSALDSTAPSTTKTTIDTPANRTLPITPSETPASTTAPPYRPNCSPKKPSTPRSTAASSTPTGPTSPSDAAATPPTPNASSSPPETEAASTATPTPNTPTPTTPPPTPPAAKPTSPISNSSAPPATPTTTRMTTTPTTATDIPTAANSPRPGPPTDPPETHPRPAPATPATPPPPADPEPPLPAHSRAHLGEARGAEVVVECEGLAEAASPHHLEARGVNEGILPLLVTPEPVPRL